MPPTAWSTPRSGSLPSYTLSRGLTLDEVMAAVLRGFDDGQRAAAAAGRPIVVGCLVTAMRHAARSTEIAELAVRFCRDGVVGFDIAGAEVGNPPTRHLDAFDYLRAHCMRYIHAGEAFGPHRSREAIGYCGADRLGHGVRVIDDVELPVGAQSSQSLAGARLGDIANYVRDKRIPLELCPSSNVQTGAVADLASHPFDILARLRFRVTVNTDNRLMGDTTMSRECLLLAEQFRLWLGRFQAFAVNAMKSAFVPFDKRMELIDNVIKPGFAVLKG